MPKKFERKKERLSPYISHTANLSNWMPLGKPFVSRDVSCRGVFSCYYWSRQQLLTNSSTEPVAPADNSPAGIQKVKRSPSQARKANFSHKLSQKQHRSQGQNKKAAGKASSAAPFFFCTFSWVLWPSCVSQRPKPQVNTLMLKTTK